MFLLTYERELFYKCLALSRDGATIARDNYIISFSTFSQAFTVKISAESNLAFCFDRICQLTCPRILENFMNG